LRAPGREQIYYLPCGVGPCPPLISFEEGISGYLNVLLKVYMGRKDAVVCKAVLLAMNEEASGISENKGTHSFQRAWQLDAETTLGMESRTTTLYWPDRHA
jgi:hypothetical protein